MLVVTGPQSHFVFDGYSGLLLMGISALGKVFSRGQFKHSLEKQIYRVVIPTP